MAEGLRVPDPNIIADYVMNTWRPRAIVCDRFRLADLRDTNASPLIPRVTRWSDASSDIRALRKAAADGPLSVATSSRALLQASLQVSRVKNDDSGNTILTKKSSNNTGRDDVAAAWLLGIGAVSRHPYEELSDTVSAVLVG